MSLCFPCTNGLIDNQSYMYYCLFSDRCLQLPYMDKNSGGFDFTIDQNILISCGFSFKVEDSPKYLAWNEFRGCRCFRNNI